MNCPNCHNQIRPDAKFCPHCGHKLVAVAPPPPVSSQKTQLGKIHGDSVRFRETGGVALPGWG